MTFDRQERATLAALADVLIPAGESFPSASEAGVAGDGLDYVLECRPEMVAGLKALLEQAAGRDPAEFMHQLRMVNPDGFAVLADLVPGAYFINAGVLQKLGYSGQTARPIDHDLSPDDVELLQSVISRGAIYRAAALPPRPRQTGSR